MNLLTLNVQYHKIPAVKKWIPLELICVVYLKYIVTSNFVGLSQILLTLYFQYNKNQVVKNGLHSNL